MVGAGYGRGKVRLSRDQIKRLKKIRRDMMGCASTYQCSKKGRAIPAGREALGVRQGKRNKRCLKVPGNEAKRGILMDWQAG